MYLLNGIGSFYEPASKKAINKLVRKIAYAEHSKKRRMETK